VLAAAKPTRAAAAASPARGAAQASQPSPSACHWLGSHCSRLIFQHI